MQDLVWIYWYLLVIVRKSQGGLTTWFSLVWSPTWSLWSFLHVLSYIRIDLCSAIQLHLLNWPLKNCSSHSFPYSSDCFLKKWLLLLFCFHLCQIFHGIFFLWLRMAEITDDCDIGQEYMWPDSDCPVLFLLEVLFWTYLDCLLFITDILTPVDLHTSQWPVTLTNTLVSTRW